MMGERLRNITGSAVTAISMFALLCSMVTINVTSEIYHNWTAWTTFGSITGSLVFIFWIIWTFIILLTKRRAFEMEPSSRKWFDLCNVILLLYWSLVCMVPAMAVKWMMWFPWLVFINFTGLYIWRTWLS